MSRYLFSSHYSSAPPRYSFPNSSFMSISGIQGQLLEVTGIISLPYNFILHNPFNIFSIFSRLIFRFLVLFFSILSFCDVGSHYVVLQLLLVTSWRIRNGFHGKTHMFVWNMLTPSTVPEHAQVFFNFYAILLGVIWLKVLFLFLGFCSFLNLNLQIWNWT